MQKTGQTHRLMVGPNYKLGTELVDRTDGSMVIVSSVKPFRVRKRNRHGRWSTCRHYRPRRFVQPALFAEVARLAEANRLTYRQVAEVLG